MFIPIVADTTLFEKYPVEGWKTVQNRLKSPPLCGFIKWVRYLSHGENNLSAHARYHTCMIVYDAKLT
jgi:hypothetical protein